MRVLLTGATGFVGGAILEALLGSGHDVIAPVRGAAARQARPGVEYRELDYMQPPAPARVVDLVRGAEVMINAVGIIRETTSATFKRLHTETPLALFAAAQSVGVSRIIQISAAGTTSESRFEYFRSKADADDFLLNKCSVPSVILRPSMVYGDRGEATALFRQLAALPIVPLPAGGRFSFSPLLVEDLAQLVLEAMEREPMPRGVIEVGGTDEMTLRDILLSMRAAKKGGSSEIGLTFCIPKLLMKPAAWFGDLTGTGPLTSDMLEMLVTSEAPKLNQMRRSFRFCPRGLRSVLRGD